jgi:hypothetical protein
MSTALALQQLIHVLIRERRLGPQDIFQTIDVLLDGVRFLSAIGTESLSHSVSQKFATPATDAVICEFPRKGAPFGRHGESQPRAQEATIVRPRKRGPKSHYDMSPHGRGL